MRFKTEKDGLEYIKGKEIRKIRIDRKLMITPKSLKACQELFDAWINLKQYMFAPEELKALRGTDHRGRKGNKDIAFRNHVVNVFVDWVEEKPRRFAWIVVPKIQKRAANAIANQLNISGVRETFDNAMFSETGKKPGTHFISGWNCSASEYEFFDKKAMKLPWLKIYDGHLMNAKEVLAFEGLQQIEPTKPQ